MSLESCASDEALAAAFLGTDMFSFESVDGFDVLLQMFIFDVILVASFVLALEWSGIGMGIEVVSQSGWTVEGFGTARPCTSESLEI